MLSRVYRLALRLLPGALRRKHGPAMEALFARSLEEARVRGRLHVAFVGGGGVWDVLRRSVYEQFRSAHGASTEQQYSPQGAAHMFGPRVPQPTPGELLRRHARSFAFAFAALTAAIMFLSVRNWMPGLVARGESASTIAEMLLLSVPFTAALTIPTAVFLAVLGEFSKLGASGVLADARRMRDGTRRLIAPVLGAAVGVTLLSFVVTAVIVPPANERLAAVLSEGAAPLSDRSMTINELRAAARNVGPSEEPLARSRVVGYQVEVQKKFVLPVACLFLALAGMAIAFRFPLGGMVLVIGAGAVVIIAYYLALTAGESFAEQLVVPPFVGMWGANVLLFTLSLLLVWGRRAGEVGPFTGVGAP